MKALILFALVCTASAQLPVARLTSIYPPSAQIGVATEIAVAGSDLDDLKELRFSTPGIAASLKDGSHFTITASTNVAPGIYDARVIGRFGASNPRAFVIGAEPQVANAGTNKSFASSQRIEINSAVVGRSAAATMDSFKFKAAKDQSLTFQCESRRIDSRMEPVLTLLDSSGKELKHARAAILEHTFAADGEFFLKLHDSQFRGGDDYWYRLAILPRSANDFPFPPLLENLADKSVTESEGTNIAQITLPAEIEGRFYPKGDLDTYQFEATKGDVWWIEVFSQRLNQNTDSFAVLQRVTKNEKGEESLADVSELSDSDANAGGVEFNTATRDPAGRFEVKETGTYRLKIRDLFAANISDPRRAYRISIHKENPTYTLVAYPPASPPLNKDAKEASPSGAFLRRGDNLPIRVLALRRDGHTADIDVAVEGLPTGVTALPCKIKSGANEGVLILNSAEDAPAWTGPVRIMSNGKEARYGSLLWHVPDYNNEAIQKRLTPELLLSVSGAEVAPLAIKVEKLEAAANAKVNVPIQILRRHEFNNPLKFTALIEPRKEFEADGKATNATLEVDLAAQKVSPGLYTFPIYATSPGRYRRITPEEAKATEEEIKKLKNSLAAAEAAKKEGINNQIKALEGRIAYRDLTATIYGGITVNVTNPPAAAVSKAP